MNKLDYVSASVPEDCIQKISPSSFASFITRPWQWYRQQIQGLDKFEYNTSSVIGTIVHYCAEQVAKDLEVNEEEIEAYINQFEENENYDKDIVRLNWYNMASVLINNYVMENKENYFEVEKQYCALIGDGVYASGTSDVIQGSLEDCMIVDYKTYNSKTQPKSISADYKYQLLVYCWILRKLGYNVTRIRLVYVNRRIDGGISEKTGKPLKSYESEVTVLTETVTDEDLEYIDNMLNLCRETILVSNKHPELRHIIWHDSRAKE
jgi:RecB family exonuclease